MSEDRVCYTSIAIHPRQINTYYQSINQSRPSATKNFQPVQFKTNLHNNRVSPAARKKMAKAIDYLVYVARPKKLPDTFHGKGLQFKLAFITLTLSSTQVHSDQTIKQDLLNQFLIEMQTILKVDKYFWRAEKQANGNIHFHILCDKFIPWIELRNVWNRIQQKRGYVTRYRENRILWHRKGFVFNPQLAPQWNYKAQQKAYREGLRTDWQAPNSTDIHSIKRINNVNKYFQKYMMKDGGKVGLNGSKEGEKVGLSGRLWGCSQILSNLKGARTDLYSGLEDELNIIKDLPGVMVIREKWFTIFYVDIEVLRYKNLKLIPDLFNVYLQNTFDLS
jgi:hypothetical protein